MTRKPDLKTDRFLVVMGGTFPTQSSPPDKMRMPKKVQNPGVGTGRPHCWVEAEIKQASGEIKQASGDCQTYQFCVMHEVVIGTIDELVASYRSKVELAVKTMLGDLEAADNPRRWQCDPFVENQAQLAKLIEEGAVYPNTHGAFTASWLSPESAKEKDDASNS